MQKQLLQEINRSDLVFIERSKCPLEQLYSLVGNCKITKESITVEMSRSFDLDDLEDPYSQVEETFYVKIGTRRIEYKPSKISELLSFDCRQMHVVARDGDSTFYCITFGQEIPVYMITTMDYFETILDMQTKLKDYGIENPSLDLDEMIDGLEQMSISIRNATKENIMAMIESSNGDDNTLVLV